MPNTATHLILDNISAQWDDDFLELSHCLLAAKDIPSFVCILNRYSFRYLPLDHIHLILHPNDDAFSELYVMDGEGQCVVTSLSEGKGFPNHDDGQQEIINYSNHACFFIDFPNLMHQQGYCDLQAYCQFPLTTAYKHIGGVEYISVRAGDFSDNEIAKLKQLTAIIAISLENVMERSQAIDKEKQLISERDCCQILVDVTNSVINQGNVCDLTYVLLKQLRSYFSLNSVAILAYQAMTEYLKGSHATLCLSNEIDNHMVEFLATDTLSEAVLQTLQPLILHRHDLLRLSKTHLHVDRFFNDGVNSVCLLPLVFRDQVFGVMALGHSEPDFFEYCDLLLLQQISARVAMALNSIQAHQEMLSLEQEQEYVPLTEHRHSHQVFDEIISQSRVMNDVLEKVALVADTDCSVLIMGETGTGKELIARAIHNLSRRNQRNMVKMNCAAVPAGLFESDLFGHERGAFTGAVSQQIGRFEKAHQGTFFLDEIGDMPLELQPKLLRVLQESEIERIGKHQMIPVDVRIIAATNVDLFEMVNQKQFRADLYYRLNVFPIQVPPLRDRPEDIPLLVKHFTREFAKKMNKNIVNIPAETLELLSRLPWFGNIRELRNVIERAVVLTRGSVLTVALDEYSDFLAAHQESLPMSSSLAFSSSEPLSSQLSPLSSTPVSKDDMTKEKIIEMLRLCNGVIAGDKGAALRLGLKRTTLISRMKKMGIDHKQYHQ